MLNRTERQANKHVEVRLLLIAERPQSSLVGVKSTLMVGKNGLTKIVTRSTLKATNAGMRSGTESPD